MFSLLNEREKKKQWWNLSFFHRFLNMQNMASQRGESTYFEVQRTTFFTGRRSMCKIDTFSQNIVWLQDYNGFRVLTWPRFLYFFIFSRPLSKTTKTQKPLQNQWYFDDFRCFSEGRELTSQTEIGWNPLVL